MHTGRRSYPLGFLEDGRLLISKGSSVWVVDENRNEQVAWYKPEFHYRILYWFALIRRVLRLGFHALYLIDQSRWLGILRKRFVIREPGANKFEEVHKIRNGSRPLNICLTPEHHCYYGEYFSNEGRGEVCIYGSKNGKNWEKVYEFPEKTIRHIHGIFWDSYRKGMWVLTGDSDEESGLWFTEDNFRSLNLVKGGSQQFRAVSVIPKQNGLILPTDTPLEKNYIQFYDLKKDKIIRLKEIEGSAFHAENYGDFDMVSTIIEPSSVNNTKYVCVYASNDGYNWKCIQRIRKPRFPVAFFKYLRYPEVELLADNPSSPFVYGYCRSLKNYHGRIVYWAKEDIRECLKN
jgi:hypothetical protein